MNGKTWTTEEIEILCDNFAHHTAREISEMLGGAHSVGSVHTKASDLMLKKDKDFVSELKRRAGKASHTCHTKEFYKAMGEYRKQLYADDRKRVEAGMESRYHFGSGVTTLQSQQMYRMAKINGYVREYYTNRIHIAKDTRRSETQEANARRLGIIIIDDRK